MTLETSLATDVVARLGARLLTANSEFARRYPGESAARQPVHTVYMPADAFRVETTREMGAQAVAALDEYAQDAAELARVFGIAPSLAEKIRPRVQEKLTREAVEDLRLDFEDGYGVRPDTEEDAHALGAAREMEKARAALALPPFFGIRIKPLNEDVRARSIRTLDLFLTAMLTQARGKVPPGFVVTLAKVTVPEQVAVLAELLEQIETRNGATRGALKLEIMVEVAQAVIGERGQPCVRELVDAGRGRCVAAHLGTYDYTASCGITAAHQRMSHPACELAKRVMQLSLAGTGVFLSDGATNVLPIAPHRAREGAGSEPSALTDAQRRENRDAIHDAWRLHAADTRASLVGGFYQGWDMHPAQLVPRYVALYAFYMESLERASQRMNAFVARAAHASADAGVADDAATGQALLNFFLRGMSCGAITEDEARATGLTLDEIRGRSFPHVLAQRAARAAPSRKAE